MGELWIIAWAENDGRRAGYDSKRWCYPLPVTTMLVMMGALWNEH